MEFESQYGMYRERVEAALLSILPAVDTRPERIHAAMHYSLAAGGKRLRPVLVLACADLYRRRVDPIAAALAVECLHTYTLVHDDLPAMDNSPLRRGRPSLHCQFDEATAVLAGDALLTEAFRLLALAYTAEPSVGLQLVATLATAADSRHLIGGQVLDTISENTRVDAATLDFIHEHKTADLIRGACLMGLHCCAAPAEALALMDQAALHMGLAFQVMDDLLDATSDAETMGKAVGQDERAAKNTYVSVHGLEACRHAIVRHSELARQSLLALPGTDSRFLLALVDKLQFRVK